jgi:hypothetical protein
MASFPLDILPEHLRQAAIPLADWGVDSHAWPAQEALEVVGWLRKSGRAILGGDVLRWTSAQRIEFTSDSWYLDKQAEWSWDEYVVRSCEHTQSTILAYLERNPKGVLLDLVAVDLERYDELEQGRE